MERLAPSAINSMASKNKHDSPVQFAYAADFARHVFVCLSSVEFTALKLLLVEQPEIGAKLPGSLNSRGLDYCGCIVYYSYEPFFRSLYVFDIERVEWLGKRPHTWTRRLRNLLR